MNAAADAGPRAFPWNDVLAAGLGLLRLSPDAFWRMTPLELNAALGAIAGPKAPAPPSIRDLAALMARYPDQGETTDDC